MSKMSIPGFPVPRVKISIGILSERSDPKTFLRIYRRVRVTEPYVVESLGGRSEDQTLSDRELRGGRPLG